MKKRKCSWRKARERTTMDETWVTPDDNTYLEHKDACKARCDQTVLALSFPDNRMT